jgi:secreted trypsin-like serine protease
MRRAIFVLTIVLTLTAAAAPAAAAPEPRIIGGTTVDATTVPWTVALLSAGVADGFYAQFCGGTLVHASWVLTAAHCLAGLSAASVEVAWGISDLTAITAADRRAISEIVVHPQYNASAKTSDVALLRLAVPATGAQTLPLNTSPSFPALNATLDTYGWGNTRYPGTLYPNLLRGVTLTDLAGPSTAGTCGFYGATYIGEHMVCAGVAGGGKDACQGDSGGPLVATTAGSQKVLVGVTSWGNGCALADFPGIWSRVSSYADWADQHINAPATPRVHIGDATVVEGDSGNRIAYFTVTVSPPPANTLTVDYATVPVTATATSDYVTKWKTLTFLPGQVAKTVTVAIRPDDVAEGTETFRVNLATPNGLDGATLVNLWGTGTILDDDATSTNQLTIGDATAREGDGGTGSVTVRTQVALTTVTGTPFTLTYSTSVGTAGTGDYVAKSGTLLFSATTRVKVVTVVLRREWIPEGDETFTVVLGTPSGGGVTVTRGTGTFTIVNDD